MKTIKELRAELAKFPLDAICYAYEGESTGIVIMEDRTKDAKYGFIPCSEFDDTKLDIETF